MHDISPTVFSGTCDFLTRNTNHCDSLQFYVRYYKTLQTHLDLFPWKATSLLNDNNYLFNYFTKFSDTVRNCFYDFDPIYDPTDKYIYHVHEGYTMYKTVKWESA